MEVKVTNWKISKLVSKLDKINDQPEYQRGKVWSNNKDALLIDSILRGIDIPKIYLRKLDGKFFDFEVADGQQRINALNNFKTNNLKLLSRSEKGLDLSIIEGNDIGGLKYDKLPKKFKDNFDSFELTIALIKDSSEDEVRTLFGRLQEGETLNPAEKRNAILSPIRTHVDSIARNHTFFENSKISARRFKWQDYVAHALTLIAYENKEDLKASLIMKLFLDSGFVVSQKMLKDISEILDIMAKIDSKSKKRIFKKHHFIDVFWFFYRNLNSIKSIDFKKFATVYDKLEIERLLFHNEPSKILDKSKSKDKMEFYNYVISFKYNGTLSESINKRALYMDRVFKKYIN